MISIGDPRNEHSKEKHVIIQERDQKLLCFRDSVEKAFGELKEIKEKLGRTWFTSLNNFYNFISELRLSSSVFVSKSISEGSFSISEVKGIIWGADEDEIGCVFGDWTTGLSKSTLSV